jgi:hypothetical protein
MEAAETFSLASQLVGDSERIEEVSSSSCRSVSTIPNMLRP